VTTAGIGATLRATRERLGWSREELAYHSGVSWSAIAQIESGRRLEVRLTSLIALATALGVSIDYLAHRSEPISPLLDHRLIPYESVEDLAASVVPFIVEGVERSEPVLVVTTRARIRVLRGRCREHVGRVDFVESSTFYESPRHALGGFRSFVDEHVAAGVPWMRIVGEPIWQGRSERDVQAWTRYESIVNLAFASAPATIVCPYDTRAVGSDVLAGAHSTHPNIGRASEVIPSTAYRRPEDLLLD